MKKGNKARDRRKESGYLKVRMTDKDAERLAQLVSGIVDGVTIEDVAEIALRSRKDGTDGNSKETLSSRDLAKSGGRQHAAMIKNITKFLCTEATESQKDEFELSQFKGLTGRYYPMYMMTEEACKIYFETMREKAEKYKSIAESLEKMKEAVKERFHTEEIMGTLKDVGESGFLFSKKPRDAYKDFNDIYNLFIDWYSFRIINLDIH